MQNLNKSSCLISSFIALWLILIGITNLKIWSHDQLSQFVATLELVVQAFTLWITAKICKDTTKVNRKIFIAFTIAVISLLINDLSFYVIIYILKISITNVPFLAFLSYYIPFLVWLGAATVFLISILVPNILEKKAFLKILGAFFIFNIVIISLFFLSLRHDFSVFSGVVSSQALTCTYKLILFDLTMLCLICVEDTGMLLLLSGIAILISGDFLINYSSVAKTDTVLVYGELVWFLGLILMFLGISLIRKNKSYEIKKCFRRTKAIKSRLILWTFSISIISFLVFFIFAYAFSLISTIVFSGLPFFIMTYSVVLVILSIMMGKYFETPFKKLTHNIQAFTDENNKVQLDDDFTIEEFIFLQKFLLESFNIRAEKDRAKQAIGDMALQVAHDIRSPASAILMMAQECNELPEERRLSLRNAAIHIEDIANNLLHQYLHNDNSMTIKPVLVSAALLSVLSEKRFQYKSANIDFQHEFAADAYFSFIKVNLSEFKRVLSNLINNGVEALSTKKIIKLMLSLYDDEVTIKVIDHGKGLPEEKINLILSGEAIISDKEKGAGLGLTHTRKFLQQCGGTLGLHSTPDGTTLSLKFKAESLPDWVADKIPLHPDDLIIVLDDDSSIHGAWDQKLSNIIMHYPHLSIQHFDNAEKCIGFINSLSTEHQNKVTLLTDYELIKQSMNGLDVIALTNIGRSILVTSHYEDSEVIKKSILLNTKILPKLLASAAKFNVIEKAPVEHQDMPDLLLLEDGKEFSEILKFLYESRGKTLKVYSSPYVMMAEAPQFPKDIKICFDCELNLPVNGIEIASFFHKKGFHNLYLATGHKMTQEEMPAYLTVLEDKMDLLNL